jgi:carbon monoxide dehydrogenase subunit G
MELKGEYRIPAPRERVWAMLNDPDVLRECIPGCQSLEKSGDDRFAARVTTKIGPVKATFNGEVALTNMNAPQSYTISGEGKGGAAGFARGGADVHLAEDGSDTVLTYEANAKVGGKLAQLGSRLIDSTAKKLADQFFDCFAAKASGKAAPAEPAAAAPAEALGEEPERARAEAAAAAAAAAAAIQPTPAGAETGRQAALAAEAERAERHAGGHGAAATMHDAEETLERKAAAGVLGGPAVWGLLVLAALIVIWFIAS